MGFHAQDPMPTGRVAGFLLQNSSYSTRPTLYANLANSGKFKLIFEVIWRDLDHIWWDPARFEEIQADFSDFWCSLVIFADSSDFFEDSGDVCRIWRLSPLIEPTRTPPEPKTNSTNWHRRSISGPFAFHPMPVGQVRAGSKIDPAQLVDSPNSQSLSLSLSTSPQ